MDLSVLYHRAIAIAEIVYDNPLVFLPLMGAWLIAELYFIINSGDHHGHTYVMSTGITLIFTAYMISPLADPDGTYFGRMHLILVLALFTYGTLLIIFGIQKKFRPLLVEFFGAPGHALIPSMMGILYVFHNIPVDKITLLIIATPVVFLAVVKTWRRIAHKFKRRNKDSEKNHCTLDPAKKNTAN
jgi:hypothetical protein